MDSPLSAYERPEKGYPVITIRTLAVNALGIPTVFFLGALAAMQFIRRPELYS
ncbi:cytochrome b559 subunit beta [Synechococcus sp. MIT S1220]|uniref:cytochrome b559 subunit beta n=1 Tax=Synechococcus sp. MIT S1220 TaxID=3082549 RepID=UPI0039AFA774